MKQINLSRSLMATGVVVALGFSQSALAEEASGTLDITAGLAEAMTVTCDAALSFGVTRLSTGDRNGSTTLTVAADPDTISATIGGAATGVVSSAVSAGSCVVSGSQANDDTVLTVTSDGKSIDSVSVSLDAAATDGLSAASSPVSGLDVGSFTLSDTSLTSGEATFAVGGTLTIPNNLTEGNLGGYNNTLTILVSDDS